MSIDTNTKGRNPLLHEHNITLNGVSEELKKKDSFEKMRNEKNLPPRKGLVIIVV